MVQIPCRFFQLNRTAKTKEIDFKNTSSEYISQLYVLCERSTFEKDFLYPVVPYFNSTIKLQGLCN